MRLVPELAAISHDVLQLAERSGPASLGLHGVSVVDAERRLLLGWALERRWHEGEGAGLLLRVLLDRSRQV